MRGGGRGVGSMARLLGSAPNGWLDDRLRRDSRQRFLPVLVAACLLLGMGLGSRPATAVADPEAVGAGAGVAGGGRSAAIGSLISPSLTPTSALLTSSSPLPAAALQARLDELRLKNGVPGV